MDYWSITNIVSLLFFYPSVIQVSSIDDNYVQCERIVNKWAESSNENVNREDKLTLWDLLFFLHIPRTGGRAYYQWLLSIISCSLIFFLKYINNVQLPIYSSKTVKYHNALKDEEGHLYL